MLPRRGWLVLVSPVREIILLLPPKAWVAPQLPGQVRVQRPAAPPSVKEDPERPSSSAPAPPVAPVALLVSRDPAVDLVVPVPDLVVPVLAQVVAVAAPVGERQELSAAAAVRISPASRSGRSGKSTKCARHPASAVYLSLAATVRP